jgi:hypothetical protein
MGVICNLHFKKVEQEMKIWTEKCKFLFLVLFLIQISVLYQILLIDQASHQNSL